MRVAEERELRARKARGVRQALVPELYVVPVAVGHKNAHAVGVEEKVLLRVAAGIGVAVAAHIPQVERREIRRDRLRVAHIVAEMEHHIGLLLLNGGEHRLRGSRKKRQYA